MEDVHMIFLWLHVEDMWSESLLERFVPWRVRAQGAERGVGARSVWWRG